LLTLLALADWSDDEGRCYPSVASIAKKVRLSEKQARRLVHRLIEADFVSVTGNKTGGATSRRYQINLAKLTPPADGSPPTKGRAVTEGSAPLPPMGGHPSHSCGSRTVSEPSTTVSAPATPPASPSPQRRGSRLPEDWVLPKTWGEWALDQRPGWNPDDVRNCADRFADYWHAKAGREASKLDWLATWRNWVRNERMQTSARSNGTADVFLGAL
jgi:hypothetical protein